MRWRWRVSMIRHASRSLTLTVGTLVISMVEAARLRLLMAAVCGATLNHPRATATGWAAIYLSSLARAADKEDGAAFRRATKALPEGGVTIIRQAGPRSRWTTETEGGKIKSS